MQHQDKLRSVVFRHLEAYKEAGKNITQLAKVCGISRDTIYKYLRGDRGKIPSHEHVMALAKGLEIGEEGAYKDLMQNPERVEGVLLTESESPDLLDAVIAVVKKKGGGSAEVAKLLAEAQFLSREE